LINGFNTFPINVMGAEDDLILNLGEDNCPAFKKAVSTHWNSFTNDFTTSFKDFMTRLNTLSGLTLDTNGCLSFCEYLKWADLHNVALSIDVTADDQTKCDAMKTKLYDFYVAQDTALNFISSN
jgi:hypothetical protein